MRPVIIFTAILALVGAPTAFVSAQDTDFSGSWTLDRDASDIPQGRGGGGRGGGGGGGRGGRGGLGAQMADALVITQSASSLTIEQSRGDRSQTVEYALDGSETTIEQGRGGVLTVTATWDGGTLVISGSQELETPRGNFSITLNELRTLSADGQALVIESTRGTPRGERTMTLVYRKAP